MQHKKIPEPHEMGLPGLFDDLTDMFPSELVDQINALGPEHQYVAREHLLNLMSETLNRWVAAGGHSTGTMCRIMGLTKVKYKQYSRGGYCPPKHVLEKLFEFMPEMRNQAGPSLVRVSLVIAYLTSKIDNTDPSVVVDGAPAVEEVQELLLSASQVTRALPRASVMDLECISKSFAAITPAFGDLLSDPYVLPDLKDTSDEVAAGTLFALRRLCFRFILEVADGGRRDGELRTILAISQERFDGLFEGHLSPRSSEIERVHARYALYPEEKLFFANLLRLIGALEYFLRPQQRPLPPPITIKKEEPMRTVPPGPMSPHVPVPAQDFLRRVGFYVLPNASRLEARKWLMRAYGLYVRKCQEEATGITQRKLADMIGVSRATVIRFLGGQEWIEGDTWRRLAAVLPHSVVPELPYIRSAVKELSLPATEQATPAEVSSPTVNAYADTSASVGALQTPTEDPPAAPPVPSNPAPAPVEEVVPQPVSVKNRMPFHVALYNVRAAAGMSRLEVAELLNVVESTVSGWESNDHGLIRAHYDALITLFPELSKATIPRIREMEKPVGNTTPVIKKIETMPTENTAPTSAPVAPNTNSFKNGLMASFLVQKLSASSDYPRFKQLLEMLAQENMSAKDVLELLNLA